MYIFMSETKVQNFQTLVELFHDVHFMYIVFSECRIGQKQL